MWQAVGHLLPIAVAVAFSSVPIMAMILILQSPKRTRSALPFLIGWTIGIALVILLSTLSAEALPERFLRQPDTVPVVLEIVAGSALVGLGIFAARRRSTPEAVGLPRWLRTQAARGPGLVV